MHEQKGLISHNQLLKIKISHSPCYNIWNETPDYFCSYPLPSRRMEKKKVTRKIFIGAFRTDIGQYCQIYIGLLCNHKYTIYSIYTN